MSLTSQTAGTAETLPNHPSRHQPDYCTLAQNFCRLGATNAQLAELFDVPTETIHLWLADIPDFAEAVRHGRVMADAYVAESLFQRATGYVETVERIMMCRGAPTTVTYKKQHPPHVAASMEWLCNRRPQNWSWHGKKEVAAEDPVDLYAQPLLPCPAPILAEEASEGGDSRLRGEGEVGHVVLSAAKDLIAACNRHEILRCAQDDNVPFFDITSPTSERPQPHASFGSRIAPLREFAH